MGLLVYILIIYRFYLESGVLKFCRYRKYKKENVCSYVIGVFEE